MIPRGLELSLYLVRIGRSLYSLGATSKSISTSNDLEGDYYNPPLHLCPACGIGENQGEGRRGQSIFVPSSNEARIPTSLS